MLKVDRKKHSVFEDEYAEEALKVLKGMQGTKTMPLKDTDKLLTFYQKIEEYELRDVMRLGRALSNPTEAELRVFLKKFFLASPETLQEAHKHLQDPKYKGCSADPFLEHFQENAYRTMCNHTDKNNIRYNIRLLRSLDYRVCPYCGCAYVGGRGDHILGAELDHFINKKDYPFFALCLYNLVPSCTSCNNHKRDNKKGRRFISPLEEAADFDSNIKIRLNSRPYVQMVNDEYHESKIEVKVSEGSDDYERYKDNVEGFNLQDAYEALEPEAVEYIEKMVRYPGTQLEELEHILAMDLGGIDEWKLRVEHGHRLEKELFLDQCAEADEQAKKINSKLYTDLYKTYRRPSHSMDPEQE